MKRRRRRTEPMIMMTRILLPLYREGVQRVVMV
jgi:hypothetical protein